MNQPLIILFLMVISAICVLATRQKHLLMILLALEGLMLSSVTLIPFVLNTSMMSMNMLCVVLLTFGACEASLGLSLLVIMSRMFGSDMMKMLSINKC